MIPSSSINVSTTAGGPQFSTLRYPKDVTYESYMDYVQFSFYDYRPPFAAETSFSQGAYNSSVSSALGDRRGSILLYMPEDLEGEYGANWQDTNLSNMARGGLGAFGALANKDIGGALGRASETLGTMGKNMLNGSVAANILTDAINKSNFGSLTVDDVFASTTGQVLNPNTEVLYKGPKMRNFTLNFKMVPRNAPEADDIKKIIHRFKYATLPRFGGAAGSDGGGGKNASFVRVPQIVDVTFRKGSSNHPWVTQFKPSVITSLNFSYTPDGAWATLPNGSPVATTMRVSFQETKMVYADELNESGATY